MGLRGSRSFHQGARPALFIATGVLIGAVLWLTLLPAATAKRQQDAWPQITLEPVLDGLDFPVGITSPADGSDRLFLIEQAGTIHVIKHGALVEPPFLDISDRVHSGGEQGLLGLAFPPDFAARPVFYVNYTEEPEGDTVIARYSVSAGNLDQADPESEEILLRVAQPYANHNGGQLAFGPDGYLYIALGDGGSAGDPEDRAQDPQELLGKILRVDVSSQDGRYAIPPSNPYTDTEAVRDEIWALGLRNPWRFSFDRMTGDLFIADVGQAQREEINFQPAGSAGGENYGWDCYEATLPFEPEDCGEKSQYVFPIYEYAIGNHDHEAGGMAADGECAVIGGYRYRGRAFPAMQGIYFYGDYCSGRIWGLRAADAGWENKELAQVDGQLTTFGENDAGELFVVAAGGSDGAVLYRIMSTRLDSPTPTPTADKPAPTLPYYLPMIDAGSQR